MTAYGVAAAGGILSLSCSSVSSRLPFSRAQKNAKLPRCRLTSLIRAKETSTIVYFSPQEPDQPAAPEEDEAPVSAEDLTYMWKLAAGSVGGASVIKYGSILFPEITRPNIVQGLLMIFVPVLVAVLILIKESSLESRRKNLY